MKNLTLEELLEKARHYIATPEEMEAQRQSWVRGEMALSETEKGMTTRFPHIGYAPMVVKKNWVAWIEPFGPNSEPVYCCVSQETAIASMRRHYTANNKPAPNDEELLLDFVSVHWAQMIEQPEFTRKS